MASNNRNPIENFPCVDAEKPADKEMAAGEEKAAERAVGYKAERRQRRQQRLELVSQAAALTVAAADRKRKAQQSFLNLSNSGPIGLWAYGMTIILNSLHYTGHWDWYAVAEGMAVVFGGGVQIIAGCLAYSRGNTFEYCMFVLSGCFWLTYVCIYALPNNSTPGGSPIVSPPTEYFLGVYYLLWAMVAFCLFCCTFFMNLAIICLHFAHFLWFLLLCIGHMAHKENVKHAAGYTGVVAGALSLYLGYAEVVNEVFDRTIVPVFPIRKLFAACQKERDSVSRNMM